MTRRRRSVLLIAIAAVVAIIAGVVPGIPLRHLVARGFYRHDALPPANLDDLMRDDAPRPGHRGWRDEATPALPAPPPLDASFPGGPATPQWPLLPGERFTVHLAGRVRDVLPELAKITGCQMCLPGGTVIEGKQARPGEAVVNLDLRNATLDAILTSLCQQVGVLCDSLQGPLGLVYESQKGPDSRNVYLQIWSRIADSRRSAFIGDYLITARTDVLYGDTAPAKKGEQPHNTIARDQFVLRFEITPRTPEATLYLVGLDNAMSATTDRGGTADLAPRLDQLHFGYAPLRGIPFHRDEPVLETDLIRPLPGSGVRRLVEVRGSLRLYDAVTGDDFTLRPRDRNRAQERNGVTATLQSWDSHDKDTTVVVQTASRPIATASLDLMLAGVRDTQTAVLVGKDGQKYTTQGLPDPNEQYSTAHKITFHFNSDVGLVGPPATQNAAPFVPDHVILTFIRCGNSQRSAPFVVRDVPMPRQLAD